MSEEEMLKPIAALLQEDLGSPDRALILGFVENESFEPNLKSKEGYCLTNPKWELLHSYWQLLK